jgi:hypothetical protein
MERNEQLAKLIALRRAITDWQEHALKRTTHHRIHIDLVRDLWERFAQLRAELKAAYPTLLSDVPDRSAPVIPPGGPFGIDATAFEGLLRDVAYCHDVLSALPAASAPSLMVSREGVFFAGEYFDALRKASDLIQRATKDILLVDGYVDATVLDMLSVKAAGVAVRILTKAVSSDLKIAAVAFSKQYGALSLKASTAFHDRFLVVDGVEFYHFGASLKDLGHRGFMFSRIEEPEVMSALRAKAEAEWAAATVVV